MRLIDYVRVFSFLAFAGSAFLSTIFRYPVFTIAWFVIMILFMAANSMESSWLNILGFTAFAYIPLGLIATFGNYLSKTPIKGDLSPFAWFLFAFFIIETILAVLWLCFAVDKS